MYSWNVLRQTISCDVFSLSATPLLSIPTNAEPSISKSAETGIIIGTVFAGVFLCVIVVCGVLLLVRREQKKQRSKNPSGDYCVERAGGSCGTDTEMSGYPSLALDSKHFEDPPPRYEH